MLECPSIPGFSVIYSSVLIPVARLPIMLAILLGMRLSHTRILLVLPLIMLKMFIALWCVPLRIMPWLMLLDMGPLFMFLVMRFRLMFLHVMRGGMMLGCVMLGGMGAMMRGWSFHFVDDDSFPLGMMGPGWRQTPLKYQARRQNKCHCHKLHTVTSSQSLPIRNI